MSMQDPISDMLTRIRNIQALGKKEVKMPSSTQKVEIARVLAEQGFIAGSEVQHEANHKAVLIITLKYYHNQPVITKINRVSRPGLRVYRSCDHLPDVLGGLGIAIISTSKGIMTTRQAKQLGVGGEVLCSVI